MRRRWRRSTPRETPEPFQPRKVNSVLIHAPQVEEIHTTLRKHLRKEEEQLLPLLLAHFSHGEQAELVAQFLCSIPLSTVEVGAAGPAAVCRRLITT